jgi:hypothetical protein
MSNQVTPVATEDTPLRGETTPAEEKDPASAQTWMKWIAGAAFLFQNAWGLIAFIYILLSKVEATVAATPQSDLNPFIILLVFSIAMGIAWFVLFVLSFVWSKQLASMRSELSKFLTFYTVFYVLVLAWYSYWVSISGGNNAIAPKPGTIGFISYAGLQMIIVLGTVFFDVYVWDVWNAGLGDISEAKGLSTVTENNTGLVTALQVLAVLMVIGGFGIGIWGYLVVLGYDMGSTWIPLGFYVGYAASYLVSVGIYIALVMRRENSKIKDIFGSAKNMFKDHWRQVDSAIIFFSFVFWVNFGFAVQLWSHESEGALTSGIHFPIVPKYYWIIIFFGIFNAIFLPVFIYYFATILCMAPWFTAMANTSPFQKSEEFNLFVAVLGTPFFLGRGNAAIEIKTENEKEVVTETYKGTGNGVLKWILRILLWLGVFYQLLFAFFIYYDLLHTKDTYLSQHFRPWYISNLVIQIFYWAIYALYAIITIARTESRITHSTKDDVQKFKGDNKDPFKNSILYCQFIRPMVTFVIVVFMETFAMSELYKKFENGHGVIPPANIADPTNPVYLSYNATFIIMFGLIYSAILCFTDMMATLYSTTAIVRLSGNQTLVVVPESLEEVTKFNKDVDLAFTSKKYKSPTSAMEF